MAKSTFSNAHDRLRTWLSKARQEAGMTQVELAKRLRRPQSYVSDLERGQHRIDVVELVQICRILKADPCIIVRELM